VIQLRSNGLPALAGLAAIVAAGVLAVPPAHADNKRLNDSVVLDVYTVQQRAGCTSGVTSDQHLELAAKWHTRDIQTNRSLDGDVGSDGSTASDRAQTAGFHGSVAETVAINPALAISGVDILRQWYYDPADLAIMSNCAYTEMGVWSENSLDRTVVVAVYGRPS
jgi:hypothetical protein